MDDQEFNQPSNLWQERRSSIRTGYKEGSVLQRLESQSFIRRTTEFFETRETANALPSLEEMSDETKNQKQTPTDILCGRLEITRYNLINLHKQTNKQSDDIDKLFNKVQQMTEIVNKLVKQTKRRKLSAIK